MKSIQWVCRVTAAAVFFISGTAFGQELPNLAGKIDQLEKQMAKMQKTIDYQNQQLAKWSEGRGPVAIQGAEEKGYSSTDFEKDLKGKIGDADTWLKGLKFSGDLRLRYEGKDEQESSGQRDRNRFRFRLRFGFEKKFNNEFKIGFGLTSAPRLSTAAGSETTSEITSTNQTFTDNFDFKAINIEKAYATYTPNWAKIGPIQKLEVTGGKFVNPFEEGSTMMVWDRDVRPEGAYQRIDGKLLKTGNLDLDFTYTAGELVLKEGNGSGSDSELIAMQGGIKPKWSLGFLDGPVEMKHLVSWYHFLDYTHAGNFRTNGSSSYGGNPLSGNDLAAGKFNIFEIYNEVAIPLPYVNRAALYADYAHNAGNNALTKLKGRGENDAYSFGAKLGELKKKGTWELVCEYYRIEANSVVSLFSDSDFGGSNRAGTVFRAAYAVSDFMSIGGSAFYTDRLLKGDPAITGGSNRQLYQLDINYKF